MNAKDILRKNAAYAVGAGVGFGLCYIYDRWRMSQIVVVPPESEERQAEVAEERAQRGLVLDAETYRSIDAETTQVVPVDPFDHEDALVRAMRDADQRVSDELQERVTESYRSNVFGKPDGDWDYEAELSTRHSMEPYILHRDEFMNDEMDFRQETMTFYAADMVMADPQENPIYNYSELMGELKFGHGSGDPNVVYIRNEVIHVEWEIVRHTSSYAVEVKGLEAEVEMENELRHSGVLKFRRD